MIGITLAATLGFTFGAAFKQRWILLHGAMAAASGALTYSALIQMV